MVYWEEQIRERKTRVQVPVPPPQVTEFVKWHFHYMNLGRKLYRKVVSKQGSLYFSKITLQHLPSCFCTKDNCLQLTFAIFSLSRVLVRFRTMNILELALRSYSKFALN